MLQTSCAFSWFSGRTGCADGVAEPPALLGGLEAPGLDLQHTLAQRPNQQTNCRGAAAVSLSSATLHQSLVQVQPRTPCTSSAAATGVMMLQRWEHALLMSCWVAL